jgi:hypothetical protein
METAAKKVLDQNLVRATYFLKLHAAVHGQVGPPVKPIRELPRAALVFAVGALDAYLSHVSSEVLVIRAKHAVLTPSDQDVLERIAGEVRSLALEVVFVADASRRLDALQRAITNYFEERVSNHGWKAVMAAVSRIGGDANAFRQQVVSAGYAVPHDKLDAFTKTRHDIVHRGQSPAVTRAQAEDCLKFVSKLATLLDSVADTSIAAANAAQ